MSNQDLVAQNQLLSHLPPAESSRLVARMRRVPLEFKRVLYQARGPMESAYFPLSGALSAVTVMEDGTSIEVATIGREGMVGLGAVLSSKHRPMK